MNYLKTALLISLWAFLLPTITLGLPFNVSSSESVWMPPYYDIEVILNSEYQKGETINIKVKNKGDETVELYGCGPYFSVYLEDGTYLPLPFPEVYPLPYLEDYLYPLCASLNIDPGQTKLVDSWNQEVCSLEGCNFSLLQQVPAGVYEIDVLGQRARTEIVLPDNFDKTYIDLLNVPDSILEGESLNIDIDGSLPNPGWVFDHNETFLYASQPIYCLAEGYESTSPEKIAYPCPMATNIIQITPISRNILGPGQAVDQVIVDYSTSVTLDNLYVGTYEIHLVGRTSTLVKTVNVVPNEQLFIDVPPSYWAYLYIKHLVDNNIAQGYGNGYFRPDWNITKAEIVKIALNAAYISSNDVNIFDTPYQDLPPTHSLTKYIIKAKELSIINESGPNFYPDQAASCIFTLEVLLRAFNLVPPPIYFEDEMPPAFQDTNSSEEKAYSTFGRDMNIVSGYDGIFFGPGDFVRRSEVAKMVYNFLFSF